MNKKKIIYFSLIIFSMIMIIAFVNKSKTLKEIEKNVTFAYYVDGVKTTTFPSKDSGYTLSEESNCTNGVSVSWDRFNWKALFKFNGFNMEQETRTKCTLYFVPYFPIPIKDYLFDLKGNTEELIEDNTNDKNLRYVGANPNNYVDFNGEKWRIIGVMNNIDNGTGTKEQRIKIIRDESIGKFSYDTSSNQTSSFSYGINNWNTSKLMKLLNGGYNEESIGGSLYWNRTNGNCYNGLNNSSTTCNFSSTGLTNEAKNMIGKAVWNLGGNNSNGWNLTVKNYYISERSTEVYQGNDTAWTGEVGLMYPSDYGFSTSGNETTTRESCLAKGMYSWDSDDCALNSWIYNEKNGRESLMQPSSETNYNIFVIQSTGSVSLWNMECSAAYEDTVSAAQTVRPVVYLKNSVKIVSGTGTKEDSFQLSL